MPLRDASLEQALAYQAGWGRTATVAHPDCVCGRMLDARPCPTCRARSGQPCKHRTAERREGRDSRVNLAGRFPHHPARQVTFGTRRDCPVHRRD